MSNTNEKRKILYIITKSEPFGEAACALRTLGSQRSLYSVSLPALLQEKLPFFDLFPRTASRQLIAQYE